MIKPKIPIIKEDWTLKQIIQEYCPYSWEKLFYTCMGEFDYIQSVLKADQHYYPETKNIFRAFDLCDFNKLKVVIIGNEPYCYSDKDKKIPYSNGLSYSINKDSSYRPPDLRKIISLLKKSVPGFKEPNNCDLSNWAKQGVLLLNKALTVRRGDRNSHSKFWNGFFHRTLKFIKDNIPDIIFVLWCREVKTIKEDFIGENGRHHFLDGIYPNSANNKFLESDQFNLINQLLQGMDKETIDWTF